LPARARSDAAATPRARTAEFQDAWT
jgi:hypothetical protein